MTLTLAVGAVFFLAAITPLLTRVLDRNAGYVGAGILAAVAAWIGAQAPAVLDDRPLVESRSWLPDAGIDFALRLDGLALMFALIVLVIGALVLAYAARYFGPGSTRTARYLALLTFFAGSMLGLVLADDALLLFVFWEFTSVSSFFLIGGLGEGKRGATQAFLTTALGGLAMLAGLILLAVTAGTAFAQRASSRQATPSSPRGSPRRRSCCCCSAPSPSRPSSRSTSGCPAPWWPRRRCRPTCTPRRWSRPASTCCSGSRRCSASVALWQVTLVLVGGGTAAVRRRRGDQAERPQGPARLLDRQPARPARPRSSASARRARWPPPPCTRSRTRCTRPRCS